MLGLNTKATVTAAVRASNAEMVLAMLKAPVKATPARSANSAPPPGRDRAIWLAAPTESFAAATCSGPNPRSSMRRLA